MTSPITQMAQGLNLNWNCCPDFCNRAASEDRDPSHVGGEWRLTTFFPLPHSKTPLAGSGRPLAVSLGRGDREFGPPGAPFFPLHREGCGSGRVGRADGRPKQGQGVGINKTRSGPFGNRSGRARRSLTWAGRLAGPMRTGKLAGVFAVSPSSSPLRVESNGKAGRVQEEPRPGAKYSCQSTVGACGRWATVITMG